ncbi:Disulfide-bond oxidoreductase YghU [compost metagenome]
MLDRRLSENRYLAGDSYTIADIAVWPWYGQLVRGNLYAAGEFLNVQQYSHVQRWAEEIAKRPAVLRGQRVNRTWGDEETQVPERHQAVDLD